MPHKNALKNSLLSYINVLQLVEHIYLAAPLGCHLVICNFFVRFVTSATE